MALVHGAFPFDLVIMLGDNMYGSQRPADFVKKFEQPYAPLLSAGVKFQASLGNHDRPENVLYKPFNMNGQRYYTYARNNVRFFALDSTQMDPKQVAWIESPLQRRGRIGRSAISTIRSTRMRTATARRSTCASCWSRSSSSIGVNVVFSGHDHVYERLKPQKGIYYFVSGAAGQLRKGNMSPTDQTAAYFDQDQSFMLVEIAGAEMYLPGHLPHWQDVDSGVIKQAAQTAGPG